MLPSTELAVRAIELATEINAMPEVRQADDGGNVDAYTAYLREWGTKTAELASIEKQTVVALRLESDQAQAAMAANTNTDGWTPELRAVPRSWPADQHHRLYAGHGQREAG